jgi:hypothetical protein
MMKKLLCLLLGHRYFVIERFSSTTRKVGCHRCGQAWGMHDDMRAFLPWDAELEECGRILKGEIP